MPKGYEKSTWQVIDSAVMPPQFQGVRKVHLFDVGRSPCGAESVLLSIVPNSGAERRETLDRRASTFARAACGVVWRDAWSGGPSHASALVLLLR